MQGKNSQAQPAVDRVLLLCTKTSPSGAPIALLRLASGLAELGHAVEARFLYAAEEINAGDFAYEAFLDHPPATLGDYLHIVKALQRYLAAKRPTTIIGFLPLASVLGGLVGKLMRVPRRICSHRVPADTYGRTMRLADLLTAWLGGYTTVIAVSCSVARSCSRYPAWLRRRTNVIYNGLKNWRKSSLSKQQARTSLGLPQDRFILAAVGRLHRQKNYPMLIRALSRVPDTVLLAIAGDGEDRQEIDRLVAELGVKDKVHLFGSLPRANIPDLLAAADLFVQPSLFEGQSNALLEALYAGLPCYVSDAPEQVETVMADDGAVAGAILPVDQPEAWSRAIVTAMQRPTIDPDLQAIVARQAAAFSYCRMMEQFSALLRD